MEICFHQYFYLLGQIDMNFFFLDKNREEIANGKNIVLYY